DPFFSKNTIHYTVKNSLQTPIFNRSDGQFSVDLALTDVDFDFEVYPDRSYGSFPLEHPYVEGKDYNPTALQNYTIFASSRFKDSAIKNIQIPLVSFFDLDFGDMNLDDFERAELELALDMDISLQNRKTDSDWSLRFRLIYYNYSSNQWEDFDGMLRAENKGVERAVWNPDLRDNHIVYLQNPNNNYSIPISDNNNIHIKNPITIKSISNHTICDGLMKFALISYILPSNYSIEGDVPENYFTYERERPQIPIEISQKVLVLESIIIGESREIMFPESSIVT
ncbi:unnamed protein product, partial [marine sediment metagenome]